MVMSTKDYTTDTDSMSTGPRCSIGSGDDAMVYNEDIYDTVWSRAAAQCSGLVQPHRSLTMSVFIIATLYYLS